MSEKYIGVHFNWIEEWSQLFRTDNWYTFHPILIEFEDDTIMGGVEFTFVLLGLGFRLRWNYTRTEQVESIFEQIAEIDASNAIRERE